MARKSSSTTPEDELEARVSDAAVRSRGFDESPLDARMLDLDDEAESPFLRGQKRVPVRRGALPRKAASRLKIALILIAGRWRSIGLDLVHAAPIRHAVVALSHRFQRQHPGLRQQQCQPLAGDGGDGQRPRSQCLFRSAGGAQETTGADSLGAVGCGDAAASQPLERSSSKSARRSPLSRSIRTLS